MDIFRFLSDPNDPLSNGKIIGPTTSKTWIERYKTAGEFTIEGTLESDLKKQLPIGSLISHIDSEEIMMVENHEIKEEQGTNGVITITGRSFECFLENRIVGSNQVFPTTGALAEITYPTDSSGRQAVILIKKHILARYLYNDWDALLNWEVIDNVRVHQTHDKRPIKRGDVYARLLEILAVDNLGIRTVRPRVGSLASNDNNAAFVVHGGEDKTGSVIFRFTTGEVENSDYLASNKKDKNCALVSGQYVEVLVDPYRKAWMNRRMMFVDANDIDSSQTENPTGTTRALIQEAMRVRGMEALAKQRPVVLTKADVSKGIQQAIYRKDYNIGDQVRVIGQDHEISTLRVTEHAEIEDDNGYTSSPTLEGDTLDDT